jgi:hypothetical protein
MLQTVTVLLLLRHMVLLLLLLLLRMALVALPLVPVVPVCHLALSRQQHSLPDDGSKVPARVRSTAHSAGTSVSAQAHHKRKQHATSQPMQRRPRPGTRPTARSIVAQA